MRVQLFAAPAAPMHVVYAAAAAAPSQCAPVFVARAPAPCPPVGAHMPPAEWPQSMDVDIADEHAWERDWQAYMQQREVAESA
jgi:hypothetical protein